MININLLPQELRQQERVRRVKSGIAVAIAAVVCVAVLICLVVISIMGKRFREAARLRQQIERLKPQAEAAETLLRKKQLLVKENEMLEGLSSQRIRWSRVLNQVSDAMPGDLFLKKLGYNSQQGSILILKGESLPVGGIKGIVEFIDALRRSPAFTVNFPDIDYYIENLEKGGKSFEIRCARAKAQEKVQGKK